MNKKYLNKGSSAPVAILVVLLVIVIGGLLIWQFWPKEEGLVTPSPSPTITPSPSPTPTPLTDETADWEVFRNEKYGYEIRYPKNWQLDLTGAPSLIRLDVERNNFFSEEEFVERWGYSYDMRFGDDIRITVYTSFGELPGNYENIFSLDEWIDARIKHYLIQKNSKKEILINEHKGVEVIETGITGWRSIFLIHNSLIYNFHLEEDHHQTIMNMFNQMLSTFRFLEGDQFPVDEGKPKIILHDAISGDIEVEVITEESLDFLADREEFRPLFPEHLKDKNPLKLTERYLNTEEGGYGWWVGARYPEGKIERILPEVRFFNITPSKEAVRVTSIRAADDSMEGNQIRIDLIYREGMWEIDWVGRRWRCWPNRGPSEWTSTSNCF